MEPDFEDIQSQDKSRKHAGSPELAVMQFI